MLPPPNGVWGLPPEELKTVIGYGDDVKKNRDEARKLMEKAGYGPNKHLALKVSTRNLAVYRDPAVILIDQLKDIYIDGELDVVESGIWFAKVARKEYSIGLNLTGAGIDDPDQTFYENFGCGSERNYTNYCNKDMQKQFDAAIAGDRRRQAQEAGLGDRQETAGGRGAADPLSRRPGHLLGALREERHHHDELARTTASASRTCGWTSEAGPAAALRRNGTRRPLRAASRDGPRMRWRGTLAAYLVRRFLLMLLTLFGISVLIFVLLRIVPGNIADILFSAAGMINPADKAQIERQLGLDQPIVIQYVQWIGGLAARRSRLLLRVREARPAGDRAAPADQREACRHGARLRDPVRHSARRHLGGAAEHAARLRAARGQPQRPVAAVVLARVC